MARRSDVERVEVDGLAISYERSGTGPPLVLLHGGVSDHRSWRRQIESLSADWTVVAWDTPGCGRSSDPPADFSLGDYADCVAGMAPATGLQRPHVGGPSFGGGLALEVFNRHRELPSSLILAGAYAGWGGSLPADEVELPRVDVPTLLLYGDADVRSSLAVADELHAAIPTSPLVVLPDVGHVSNVEAPDAFDPALRHFLTEVDDHRPVDATDPSRRADEP